MEIFLVSSHFLSVTFLAY